jgi:hypothetical protein
MSQNVDVATVPAESLIFESQPRSHYLESYRVILPKGCRTDLSGATRSILFDQSPAWIDTLMSWRNRFAKLVGLKVTEVDKQEVLDNFSLDRESLGIFKIYATNDFEVILGDDDWHLDFRVSIRLNDREQQEVVLTTAVNYKNWFGRIYFFPVSFIHRLMVAFLLRNARWRQAVAK